MNTDLMNELLKLAEHIRDANIPYDHNRYFTFGPDVRPGHDGHTCMTAACLGGYAAEHEPFTKLGLHRGTLLATPQGHANEERVPVYAEPRLGARLVGLGALCALFELTEQQGDYIFGVTDEDIYKAEGYDYNEDNIAEFAEVDYSLPAVIARLKRVMAGEI